MTNKELVNFKFVNRTEARKDANLYLRDKQKSVLAIFGKNKAGKNYFIDQLEKENKDLTFFIFNFKEISINPIKFIMSTLYGHNNNAFMKFINKNYKKIVKGSATIIDLFTKTEFAKIYDCLSDKDCTFVNSNKYHESPINVTCKYIKETAKYEKVVIVFKNVTSCERIYINNLFEIIATIYEYDKANVRFIISFDEDIYNKDNTFCDYLSKFHYIPINIEKFSDSKFFLEILKDIFDITTKNKSYLEHLFNICDGYPGELKTILDKAYQKSYKSFEGTANLHFDETLIEQAVAIIKQPIELNPLEKIILTVVLFVDFDFTYEQLITIISYILTKLHFIEYKINIEKTLQTLLSEKQLLEYNISPNYELQYVVFDRASKRDLYMSVCQNEKIFPQLAYYIFGYIIENEEYFKRDLYRYHVNCAFFAWKAQITNWINLNYEAGQYFFNKNELSLSENIFLRISEFTDKLEPSQIYKILLCFYNTGNYKVALDIISDKSAVNISDYNYLLLKIKILNINMNKGKAVDLIDFMLKSNEYTKHTYELLDLKQRILSNIKEKRAEAKCIFDKLLSYYSNKKIVYDNFLISSMEYYRGEIVQNNFKILEKQYRKNNDFLMLGELLTNKGFDLFWQGKIQEASNIFSESITILETLRIHETSYILNNYANCLMMTGNYKQAINNLNSALLFNESNYAKITIKTNLMVCYAITEDMSYDRLFQELVQYLKENEGKDVDISISLKVKYALGFVQEYLNLNNGISNSRNFQEEAKNEADMYDSKTLPYLWFKNWKNTVEVDISKRLDENVFSEFYRLRFEPWLLTITHD